MKRLPEKAIKECLVELRAACRLPIDQPALDLVVEWLRPNFERILAHPDGARRWADHGDRMRDNARHMGAFADFFGSRTGNIGAEELKRAFQIMREDCTVRAEVTPIAYEYCRRDSPESTRDEKVLRDVVPVPEPV